MNPSRERIHGTSRGSKRQKATCRSLAHVRGCFRRPSAGNQVVLAVSAPRHPGPDAAEQSGNCHRSAAGLHPLFPASAELKARLKGKMGTMMRGRTGAGVSGLSAQPTASPGDRRGPPSLCPHSRNRPTPPGAALTRPGPACYVLAASVAETVVTVWLSGARAWTPAAPSSTGRSSRPPTRPSDTRPARFRAIPGQAFFPGLLSRAGGRLPPRSLSRTRARIEAHRFEDETAAEMIFTGCETSPHLTRKGPWSPTGPAGLMEHQ